MPLARVARPQARGHQIPAPSAGRTLVADFLCAEALLIIEIDGSQHADSEYDRVRGAALGARGFRILRFWNDEVLREMDSVCDTIIAYVRDAGLKPWR